ncbi:hypothetical protein Pfo_019641 [Paulownia fortunei]|nr:hypothetical protein Pfo_019641 [Paulownia fortunei]
MRALQASTSYSVGFGISSVAPLPLPSRHRYVILAKAEPTEKSVEIMRKFSEQYARRSDTYFCVDKGVTSVVIKGLAEHKDTLGAPLCPCRHYDDKAAEVQQGFWNCPCVPMRERKECHCMLFLTPRTILLARTRPFRWKRSEKQRRICDALVPYALV